MMLVHHSKPSHSHTSVKNQTAAQTFVGKLRRRPGKSSGKLRPDRLLDSVKLPGRCPAAATFREAL